MLRAGGSGVVLAPRALVLLHPGRLNKPGHKGVVLVVEVFASWAMWVVGGSQRRISAAVVVLVNCLGMGDGGDSGKLALLA